VLPFDLAVRLRSAYRDCYTYAWQEGSGTFVGSSPELLAAVDGNRIVSEPLAGTAARGGSDELDRALGETLMASKKNRSEHRMVVEDIADRLADITLDLDVPARPMLRRTANVQHLATRITGILDSPRSVGDVARILHPTPAIGGVPRDESAAFIRKLEQIDRGWYAGAVGWSDHTGEGEMALALRCALIRGKEARLFAGNGIVAGSEPTAELEETRLKFRPLLSLLTEV
jgi:isochorismate synthase